MLHLRRPTLAAALLLSAALLHAAIHRPEDPLGRVPDGVRSALEASDWDAALAQLDGARAAAPERADLWLYLRGVALAGAGRGEEATDAFEELELTHPDSAWRDKARFRRADLFRDRRAFEQAEAIWAEAARRLRGAERQGELAGVYLRFAEAAAAPDPAHPDARPDHGRARELTLRALELEAPRDLRLLARERVAASYEAEGSWPEAAAAHRATLAEFGDAPPDARSYRARLGLGLALARAGQARDARATLEDLSADLADLPADAELADLAARARFGAARTLPEVGEAARGRIAALERAIAQAPRADDATPAALEVAELWWNLGRAEEALAALDAVLERPAPESAASEGPDGREALRRHSDSVARARFLRGIVLPALGRTEEAIAAFEDYVRRYPAGPDWSAAQRGAVDVLVQAGVLAFEDERYAEARAAWRRFLEAHPLDGRGAWVTEQIADATWRESQALTGEAADERVREALDQWASLVEKYPGSDEASRALLRAGLALETRLGDVEGALERYRACTFGAAQGDALARVQVLLQPSLRVLTERTWRTHEEARVHLYARNVPRVEVAVWALDLEAYFQKHLSADGVHDLDLDLIAPDKRRTIELPGYAPYAPLEQDLALPDDLLGSGPGVWAVSVRADELRATTLVLRSDLEVLVKASPREVFVYAQDMRAGAPAAGVRIVAALPHPNATPTLRELTTDAGGIARLALDGEDEATTAQVLAVREGHFATTGETLAGMTVAVGRTARAHVSTDRPAYRPGERLHWRAIVREVRDGRYAFTPGATYRFEARDSQGRVLASSEVALSDFGTTAGSLDLPDAAPAGDYELSLRGPELPRRSARFRVDDYELARARLELEPRSAVVHRGEEVELRVRALYAWGEPVADSPLEVGLPDGRRLELRTDREGSATVSFDTRDFLEERALEISARLVEENVTATRAVWLAQRGYRAAVAVQEPVVLAGRTFEATVRTTGPDGAPLGRAVRLEVARLATRANGRTVETSVSTQAVETSSEDGLARVALTLSDGGTHVLRVLGVDRYGDPVTATTTVVVSGDDDQQRMHLFADATHGSVGDHVALRVVNRARPGLALVTFETDRVEDFRLMTLGAGETPLDVELTDAHVPGVAVAVALLGDGALHDASVTLSVARGLTVEVVPSGDVAEPGAETEVLLRATDRQGRPVQAELCLAVVDDALFGPYPDGTPAPAAFFDAGVVRTTGLRTSASCTFRYEGTTETIAEAVLVEAQRGTEELAWNSAKLELQDRLYFSTAAPVSQTLLVSGMEPEADFAVLFDRGITADGSAWRGPGDTVPPGGAADARAGRPGDRAEGHFDGDTAFWTPAVVTDAAGEARLRFRLPDRATRWRLTARGVDRGTLAGEARAHVVARARLVTRLRVPALVVEGDAPRVGVELHVTSPAQAAGTARLTLRAGTGADAVTQVAEVPLVGGAVDHRFPALAPVAGRVMPLALDVEVQLAGETLQARTEAEVRVRPAGVEVADTASGELRDGDTTWLDLPAGARGRRLSLWVGRDLSADLVDRALADAGGREETGALAGDLLGLCAVLERARATGRASQPDHERLVVVGQALAAELVARMDGGHGWSFDGRTGPRSPQATARAAWALAQARRVGLAPAEDALDAAITALRERLAATGPSDAELRAELHHALAALGAGDFAALNALHRERASLSPAALAYTALALCEMERAPLAAELATLLEQALARDGKGRLACRVADNRVWNRGSLEMTALATLALQRALPSSPRRPELEQALAAGAPWRAPRGRGLALAAAAHTLSVDDPRGDLLRVRVDIGEDGGPPWAFELDAERRGEELVLDLPDDGARRVRVAFRVEGRGAPRYRATLTGFSRELGPESSGGLHASRLTLLAPAPRYAGRDVPTGFRVLSRVTESWRNERTQVARAGRVRAELQYWSEAPEEGDYLQAIVPLPAGARLVAGTVTGSVVGTPRMRDGALVVPLGGNGGGVLGFELVGLEPGTWRALPARVVSLYDVARSAHGEAGALTVLERNGRPSDAYRPTPDELYHLGLRSADAGEDRLARAVLTELLRVFGDDLRNDALAEAATRLLYLSLDAGESADVVRYFEIVREKRPDLVVPFDEVLRVAEAYHALREHERAGLIYRAVLEETFGQDLKVVAALEEQGETAGALETLAALVRAYPDAPAVVQTELALYDRYLMLAPGSARDERLARAGWDRARLVEHAIVGLERFLAMHPSDPLAPEAGLNLISAVLELGDRERGAELAGEMAAVYTAPRFLDAFQYSRGVALWYLGREDEATGLLRRITEARYPTADGGAEPSENRSLALYILAQIHHARGEVDEAARLYEEVSGEFSDARETLRSFHERRVRLPEVTEAAPGEGVDLRLTHKNVQAVELSVYGVDLMTLYLREKDLSHVALVDLAGISPALRRTVQLEAGSPLRETETTVHLDLPRPGAYLVLCRGGTKFGSGLVLVSDLELEVSEDATSGRVRVQVLSRGDGAFVRGADVRIVGSMDGTVRAGETDPRGLFVTDGVRGSTTVIARLAGEDGAERYAFFRGTTPLAIAPQTASFDVPAEYLDNVRSLNRQQQVLRDQTLDEEMQRTRKGLQVERVK